MYYADNNSNTTPQMLRFAGTTSQVSSQSSHTTQPSLSAITTYNTQPFLVQSPSNMYASSQAQYIPMSIASQTAQDYVCMPNTAGYNTSGYAAAAAMTQAIPSTLQTQQAHMTPPQQQLQHHPQAPLCAQQVLSSSQLQQPSLQAVSLLPTQQQQQQHQQQQLPQPPPSMLQQQQQPPPSSLQQVSAPVLRYSAVNSFVSSSSNSNQSYNGKNHMTPVQSDDDRYRKQLIVNYLAPDVTSSELHALFSRFGPLDGARIIYDRQTCMPRGYGFVYFHYPESAKEAVDTMNGYEFHGKRLKVSYSTNPLNIISTAPVAPYQ